MAKNATAFHIIVATNAPYSNLSAVVIAVFLCTPVHVVLITSFTLIDVLLSLGLRSLVRSTPVVRASLALVVLHVLRKSCLSKQFLDSRFHANGQLS